MSEFIAFITCESCEITKEEKRKTINGEDIIRSMRELNFEDYLPNIEFYNKKYKSTVKGVPEEEVDDDNEESIGSSAENESRFWLIFDSNFNTNLPK